MPQTKERLPRLTPPLVARIVDYSTRRIQQLCEDGTLDATRVGGQGYWRIKPEAICRVFDMSAQELNARIRAHIGRTTRDE